MADNYYLILGIHPDAGLTQIRRAYRRLALRFHPDVAGDEGVEQFERVREAFETLTNTARRADHDRRLVADHERRARASEVEPLFSEPIDLLADFGTVRPGTEEVLAHVLSNFTGRAPKSNPTRELNVEIVLTPRQAEQGGRVTVTVPVARVCATCGGTGRAGFFTCDACAGHGTTWERAHVDVHVPRHARSGAVVETPLVHLGIRNMWLKTHVRVSASTVAGQA